MNIWLRKNDDYHYHSEPLRNMSPPVVPVFPSEKFTPGKIWDTRDKKPPQGPFSAHRKYTPISRGMQTTAGSGAQQTADRVPEIAYQHKSASRHNTTDRLWLLCLCRKVGMEHPTDWEWLPTENGDPAYVSKVTIRQCSKKKATKKNMQLGPRNWILDDYGSSYFPVLKEDPLQGIFISTYPDHKLAEITHYSLEYLKLKWVLL